MTERHGADAVLLLTDRDGDGVADSGAIERALEDASVGDRHLSGGESTTCR